MQLENWRRLLVGDNDNDDVCWSRCCLDTEERDACQPAIC